MKKFLDLLTKAESYICVFGLAVMTFLTAGNIIARKIFNSSWSFTEELACAFFILITMFGAAMSARRNNHICVDILPNILPRGARKPLLTLAMIIEVAFGIILVIFGIGMVASEVRSGQTTPALHIKEWIYGLTIPVGGFFITVHALEFWLRTMFGKEEQ